MDLKTDKFLDSINGSPSLESYANSHYSTKLLSYLFKVDSNFCLLNSPCKFLLNSLPRQIIPTTKNSSKVNQTPDSSQVKVRFTELDVLNTHFYEALYIIYNNK